MTNFLFNKKHLKEYMTYGSIAGLLYILCVWRFLYKSDHYVLPVIGSILFMFVIMIYAVRLTRRKTENYSIWAMIIAGQMAVVAGILISTIVSFILCCFYIPGFENGNGDNTFLRNTADGSNAHSLGATELIFITATFENYGAGAFISAMIAYALKPDQTKDTTLDIFEEPADLKNL